MLSCSMGHQDSASYTHTYTSCHLRMCWSWWGVILCWYLWCWWARKTPQRQGNHRPQLCRGVLTPLLSVLALLFYECSLGSHSWNCFLFLLECNCFCCVRFCRSTEWISYVYTYISHLGSLSHPRPHPTPLRSSQSSQLELFSCYAYMWFCSF